MPFFLAKEVFVVFATPGPFVALVCLAILPVTAGAQSRSLKAHRLAGGEYVAVSDIAEFYALGRNRSGSRERADYQTPASQLIVQAGRREIRLDGVQHWLSAPVLSARGKLWVSSVDVLKGIDPVLRQGRSRTPSTVSKVVIDPGHGGSDRGTRGTTGIEKQLTLDLAKRLQRHLQRAGVSGVLTRTSDRAVPLADRVDLAGSKRADLFVSLHFNSGGSADGIETYCLPPAGQVSTVNPSRGSRGGSQDGAPGNRFDEKNVWLAHCVQKSLLRSTDAADRGVRRARFYVLRYAPCPAILVEAGFLTNRAEEQKILNSEYREALAKAIADGILTYKSSAEKRLSRVAS
jgi:N-acetylmuramoyl-L-alanine amidase